MCYLYFVLHSMFGLLPGLDYRESYQLTGSQNAGTLGVRTVWMEHEPPFVAISNRIFITVGRFGNAATAPDVKTNNNSDHWLLSSEVVVGLGLMRSPLKPILGQIRAWEEYDSYPHDGVQCGALLRRLDLYTFWR